MSALLESAIAYAEAGFRVHPCRPNQKEPILDGWQKLATRDPGTIASWWGRRPNANVAIACGGPARLLVVPEAARTEGTGINASTDSVSLFKTVPAHSCTACGPSHLKALVLGCYGLAEKGLGAPNRNRSPRAGLGFGIIHKSERSPPMSLRDWPLLIADLLQAAHDSGRIQIAVQIRSRLPVSYGLASAR
jgi:hypothetical protein